MPIFWLGLLLMLVFSVYLAGSRRAQRRLEAPDPAGHRAGRGLCGRDRPHDTGLHAGGRPPGYIRTARANGLREWVVIYKHALKNAMIPVITVFGLEFATCWAVRADRDRFLSARVGRLMVKAFSSATTPSSRARCSWWLPRCLGEPADRHCLRLFRPEDPL